MTKPKRKPNPLGRLTAFGVREPWQAALLLPKGWEDFSDPCRDFASLNPAIEDRVLLAGHLSGVPNVMHRARPPRLQGTLRDASGAEITFSAFGDTRGLERSLREAREGEIALYGKLKILGTRLWLTQVEHIDPQWLGRLRPRYPGKTGVINANTVRERILQLLPAAADEAAAWLHDTLQLYHAPVPGVQTVPDIAQIARWLREAHTPKDWPTGQAAQDMLERLAAWGVVRELLAKQKAPQQAVATPVGDWQARAKYLPFTLTADQTHAVNEILADIASGRPMHRFLNGDVGTGKTAVFAVAVAAVLDAGGTAAIMLPTERLAEQVADQIASFWNDLDLVLVTGSGADESRPLPDRQLVIGTSALLHRDIGPRTLVVVDEQQKFSRAQREGLQHTHLLEASATCIPRSQALVQYGLVQISRLHTGHAEKHITTRLYDSRDRAQLFASLRETVERGEQALILYPRIQDETGTNRSALHVGIPAWRAQFGDRVVFAHGQQSADDNARALRAMHGGKASVLVATTVVEVGIDIPGLTHGVVVDAGRLGVTQLHQIRGRLVRQGGEGKFDLLLRGDNPDTRERLDVLTRSQDGFAVAEADLAHRGFGDLSADSDQQAGADETFLFGRGVRPDLIESLLRGTL